jgi:hypothetical protein
MGPPNDVAAAGSAGAKFRDGPLRPELRDSFDGRAPLDAGRAPFDAARAAPFVEDATGCSRGGTATPVGAA